MGCSKRKWSLKVIRLLIKDFVLEVLGSFGAIWGPSEGFNLRNANNKLYWQLFAGSICLIFFIRFIYQNCCKTEEKIYLIIDYTAVERTKNRTDKENDVTGEELVEICERISMRHITHGTLMRLDRDDLCAIIVIRREFNEYRRDDMHSLVESVSPVSSLCDLSWI